MSRYQYRNVAEIKQQNAAHGHHFFDPDTMRFFNSRVGSKVYCGRYFITSERNEGSYYDRRAGGYQYYDYGRKYSVRKALPSGEIVDVSGFQALNTHNEAQLYIQRLIKRAERITH